MIKEIKKRLEYNDGLFSNSSYKNIAIMVNELINKSNEQTKVINQLLKENQELKEKLKSS